MITLNQAMQRSVIIVFWVITVFGVLYSPRMFRSYAKKTINVFMWSGTIDPKMFLEFEKETGIHVNASYYEGNEELLTKLLATKGRGYDLVVPSDYVVEFLIRYDLLQKLDKTKLNFLDALNPQFLNRYFDPKNEYSIPSEWYIQGLGINKNYFPDGNLPEASWSTLFDLKKVPNHVGLINDSRELAGLAINYLYGKVRPINKEEVTHVTQLLVDQRKRVEAYTDFRGDFLLESGNCSVVMIANSFIWKTVRDNPHIAYLIPREGTFLNLENYVIPAASKKAEMVYEFMNFLFRLDVQKHNFENGVLLSTRKDADFMFNDHTLMEATKLITPNTVHKIKLFRNFLSDEQINDIWLSVKGL